MFCSSLLSLLIISHSKLRNVTYLLPSIYLIVQFQYCGFGIANHTPMETTVFIRLQDLYIYSFCLFSYNCYTSTKLQRSACFPSTSLVRLIHTCVIGLDLLGSQSREEGIQNGGQRRCRRTTQRAKKEKKKPQNKENHVSEVKTSSQKMHPTQPFP